MTNTFLLRLNRSQIAWIKMEIELYVIVLTTITTTIMWNNIAHTKRQHLLCRRWDKRFHYVISIRLISLGFAFFFLINFFFCFSLSFTLLMCYSAGFSFLCMWFVGVCFFFCHAISVDDKRFTCTVSEIQEWIFIWMSTVLWLQFSIFTLVWCQCWLCLNCVCFFFFILLLLLSSLFFLPLAYAFPLIGIARRNAQTINAISK